MLSELLWVEDPDAAVLCGCEALRLARDHGCRQEELEARYAIASALGLRGDGQAEFNQNLSNARIALLHGNLYDLTSCLNSLAMSITNDVRVQTYVVAFDMLAAAVKSCGVLETAGCDIRELLVHIRWTQCESWIELGERGRAAEVLCALDSYSDLVESHWGIMATRARLELLIGNHENAAVLAYRALALAEERGELGEAPQGTRTLCDALIELRRPEECIPLLEAALEPIGQSRVVGDRLKLARSAVHVFIALGRPEEAMVHARMALSIVEGQPHLVGGFVAHLLMARVLRAQADGLGGKTRTGLEAAVQRHFQAANQMLEVEAAHIGDDRLRARFLQAHPEARAVREANGMAELDKATRVALAITGDEV